MSVTAGSSGAIRVVVYDSRIQGMSAPGGQVHTYVRHKTSRAAAMAQMYAPARTGRLRGGIRTDVRTVRNGAVGRVRSTAKYSVFVHEGTGPEIFPDGEFLWVPIRKGSTKRRKMDSVSGQKANPFLMRGLTASMGEPYRPRRLLSGNPFG